MNNTKTIFKSLLIMIVAISLFTVSCSKDEGGTKTPTTPTIQKITDANLTETLKALGELGDTSKTVINFGLMTDPANGTASITKASTEDKSLQKVKQTITTVFQTPLTPVSVTLTFKEGQTSDAAANNSNDLVATIVFTAKSGFEFDTTITGGTKYTYNKDAKTATLTLTIKLNTGDSWEA